MLLAVHGRLAALGIEVRTSYAGVMTAGLLAADIHHSFFSMLLAVHRSFQTSYIVGRPPRA